jgi:putative heme-binding domain-containing protein
LKQGEKTLGPFMGQVASVMKPDQIATAILRPDNTISQGFRTTMFLMDSGKTHTGFVTFNSADKIIVRDATGKAIEINPDEIEAEKHLTTSMMPKGLVNGLSLQDFVSLVSFLSAQK